jgi:hypothetical protein
MTSETNQLIAVSIFILSIEAKTNKFAGTSMAPATERFGLSAWIDPSLRKLPALKRHKSWFFPLKRQSTAAPVPLQSVEQPELNARPLSISFPPHPVLWAGESLFGFGDRCAVTGRSVAAVLRASHARPWCQSTDQQRLDANNGLPLTATLDALFDRGLIGFTYDGSMVCSPLLQQVDRKLLNVPAPLLKPLNHAQKEYLRDHRRAFGL